MNQSTIKLKKTTRIDADEFYSESNLDALKTNLSSKKGIVTEADFQKYLKDTKTERQEQLKETQIFTDAKRAIATEKYEDRNHNFIEANLGEDDVTYTSKYAPMIITEATPAEIKRIAKKSNTISISLYTEDDIVVSKQTTNTTELISAEGLTGEGVTVGLIESGCPKTNNADISSSDITKLSTNTTDHATMTSAIILGKNGITPKAKMYSVARGNSAYAGIEQLLDKGVQLISMSNSTPSSFYDNMAKWIDHVIAQHGVSFITSAGTMEIMV